MSVPNFSSLARLEVAKKFGVVVVVGWFQVATMSNLNTCFLELLSVELI